MGQSISVRRFDIIFDNANKTYSGGDIVSGNIVIENNNSETEIKGVQVILRGDVKGERTVGDGRYTMFFKPQEKILGYTYFVLGDGRTSTILPAGRSTFPVQFTLPSNCPSSRKYSKCCQDIQFHVKYSVQARILSSSSGVGDSIKENITVNAKVDLNMWPDANQPVVRTLFKDMKSRGILSLVIKIPRTGFILGEVIPVEFQVESGGESYKGIKIELKQHLSYHCTPERTRSRVKSICNDKIPGGTYGRVECNLRIPNDIPASSVGFSDVVDMHYYIRVKFEVDWNTKQCVHIPVIIGNVPVSA